MTDEERRERRRVLSRARYAKNPEMVKARVARYLTKYPEKKKALNKKNHAKYKYKYKRTTQAWYIKSLEKRRSRCRTYYTDNKEAVLRQKQRARLTKVFASVVDVEVREILVATKLLHLEVKRLLKHGETNEKRS